MNTRNVVTPKVIQSIFRNKRRLRTGGTGGAAWGLAGDDGFGWPGWSLPPGALDFSLLINLLDQTVIGVGHRDRADLARGTRTIGPFDRVLLQRVLFAVEPRRKIRGVTLIARHRRKPICGSVRRV